MRIDSGTVIAAESGFLEIENYVHISSYCHLACKGGEVVNTTNDLCQPGHSGPICDVCTKGWSKDDGVCLKCPENMSRTMSLTILIPVVCIFIIS